MKLYNKKLNSVEELKREQLRLKYERLRTKSSDLMPVKELKRHKKSNNLLGMAFEVMNSKSTLETAWKLALPLLGILTGKRKVQKQHQLHDGPRKKGFIKSVLSDVITSYLTGKAVLIGISALQLFLRTRKNKRRRLREEELERNRGW